MRSVSVFRAVRAVAATLVATVFVPVAASADDFARKITIDVIPVYNATVEGDGSRSKSNPAANDLGLDYNLDYAIDRRTSLFYNHHIVDAQAGRVLLRGTGGKTITVQPADAHDYFTTLELQRSLTKSFAVNVGYFRRTRRCCPADSDPTNQKPLSYGGEFIGATARFGPYTRVGPVFTYDVRVLDVHHPYNAAVTAGLPAGQAYLTDHLIFPMSLTVRFPVYGQRQVVPFMVIEKAADFFISSPVPTYNNAFTYGFVRPINRWMTFRADVRAVLEQHHGTPFGGNETVRYRNFQAYLDFKLRK